MPATVQGRPFARAAQLDLASVRFVGSDLVRPECVLATRSGDLYSADWRGGVACIRPDGSMRLYTGRLPDGQLLKTNALALRRDGSFLITHLGDADGGVYELRRDGTVRPFLVAVDGTALPPTNYVAEDAHGRVWITVSTRHVPRLPASRPDIADGFIVLADARGARIVADGLGYTNEALVSPDGRWLYANETFGRRLSRFAIRANGDLGERETVVAFGHGVYPDGLTFDAEGGVWITSIVSNRVIRVAPDGAQQLMLDDSDPDAVQRAEDAYWSGTITRTHLDQRGTALGNVSSLAFGGPDLRTAYLGCLLRDRIGVVRVPVPGHPPPHWAFGPFAG